VINAAIDSGLRVPQDIEVLSIIGTKYVSIIRPQLSSLHLDLKEVGSKAVMMLSGLLTDEQKENVEFESTFVKRASTLF
jgi:LacI family transcriptional regulator